MKVLMINGSPHKEGSTYTVLTEVGRALAEDGVESEIVWLGTKPIQDCTGCARCTELGKCVFDDEVNAFVERAKSADGFIFGSPVYYAHPSGRIIDFLNRTFYSGGGAFAFKPAAAVSVSRRAGSVTTFDVLNKYMSINQMPIVSSTYWNEAHGAVAKDVPKDEEGMQTMYNLGKNMAWLLRCIEAGKEKGILHPDNVKKRTNFIR